MLKLSLILLMALPVPALSEPKTPVGAPAATVDLRPSIAGESMTLVGKVLAVEPGRGGTKLFKVAPEQAPERPVWVTTFVRVADGEINVGDRLSFRGYVTTAEKLDPSGKLEAQLGVSTILQARGIETPAKAAPRATSPADTRNTR